MCIFPRSGVGLPTKSENKEKVTECIFHVLQNENMFQSGGGRNKCRIETTTKK